MIVPFDHDDPSIRGKTVLIGITYFDATGKETRRAQWWGTILAFNPREGLLVDLANSGKHHAFPPLADALHPAKPGCYALAATGEVIEDPDLLYTMRQDPPSA